jgi:uncharacterized membrane protein (UPF0127 family)
MGKRVGLVLVVLIIAGATVLGLRACDDTVSHGVQSVKIGGEWFHLEIADTDPVRMKGLGQRDHIDDTGGMLFVFTQPQNPERGGFVMRDCPIDIDIIYLDGAGRIGNWHAMKADPRKPGEGEPGETGVDANGNEKPMSDGAKAYEARLHRYEPRYAYQFTIELNGGTIEGKLKGKIKEGDKIDMPLEALKKHAK